MMDDLLQEMIDPAPQRADVSRWRRLGATAAIFALAGLGITSLTTNALFTDRETTAGDLLTGTVDLSLGGFSFTLPDGGMAPGDIVVHKRNWGAFYGTDLDLHLRRRGVTTIVLAGIATNFGVESTARDAWERNYAVVIAEDACTTASADLHKVAIEVILPRISRIVKTADVTLA